MSPEHKLEMAKLRMQFFAETRDNYQRYWDTVADEIAELERRILDQQRADVTVEIQPLAVEGEAN